MRLIYLLIVSLLIGACGSPGPVLPDREVELFEFGLEAADTWTLATGVKVTNGGEFPHTLVISNDQGTVLYASDVLEPGDSINAVVNLLPGEYELTCRLVAETGEGELVDHFEAGMRADVIIEN